MMSFTRCGKAAPAGVALLRLAGRNRHPSLSQTMKENASSDLHRPGDLPSLLAESSRRSGLRRWLWVGILLLTAAQAGAAEKPLSELYKETLSSVVVLRTAQTLDRATPVGAGHLEVDRVLTTSSGSGVLVADNLVLTAAHVVQSADQVEVVFVDNTSIPGSVISSDVDADLALVRLHATHPGTKPAVVGDSDKVRVGEDLFVIGAPAGLPHTLTKGIVSGRYPAGSKYSLFKKAELFQTDAALNPGNSGGPLFNMKGELIGIASYIKTRAGGSDGLGFAVTINTAKARMLEQNPFYLGLDIRYAKGLLAEALNIPQGGAMLVQTVAKGSLAAKMGVQGGSMQIQFGDEPIMLGGDVILEIDGVSVASLEDLSRIQARLGEQGVGQGFELKLLRHGQIRRLIWRGE